MLREKDHGESNSRIVRLPAPELTGATSVEEALARRRSVREFTSDHLSLGEISQLLWAAQGVTGPSGGRTAPSAGACYPLETYLVSGEATGLVAGLYRYLPGEHSLRRILEGDIRYALAKAAKEQWFINDAPVSLAFTAFFDRTVKRYGRRGQRYVYMDVAHAAQNVHLQVISLDLGTVVVGAFDDERVAKVLGLDSAEKPLVIMPIGRPKAR